MLEEPVGKCLDCPLGANGDCAFAPRTLPAGAQLWLQGEVPNELIFVKSGLLGVSTTDLAGLELGTGVRGPRSLLGFESLRAQPARASVESLTEAVVCWATPAAVHQRAGLYGVGSGPIQDIAFNAAALLQLTLDELLRVERDGDLRSGSALSRVARFILSSGALIASGQHAPFSKRHVAALLGLRPETMSRCLRALKTAKLITAGREVRVLDEARLRELARGASLEEEPLSSAAP